MKRYGKPIKRDSQGNPLGNSSGHGGLYKAFSTWPLHECLISETWRTTMDLTHVLVTRKPPKGGYYCCLLLVDQACLGVKNGKIARFKTDEEYDEFVGSIRDRLAPAEYLLGVKIVRDSIAYAQGIGFSPAPAAREALAVFGSLEIAAECPEEIPTGDPNDGMPFFIAGPNDNSARVLGILRSTCGEGNYHFIMPLGPMPSDL